MGKTFLSAGCALLVATGIPIGVASAAEDPTSSVAQEDLAAARAAVGELGGTLMGQLKAAIAASGPAEAVEVCRTIAPQVAGQVSSVRGLKVGRTALKVRNPANAPDDFERTVLLQFLEQSKAGADLSKLEHAEIVSTGGEKRLRYMKAIPMAAEPCQTCHGANIAPNVAERIRSLYPDDQATGFKAGELRGAFSVSAPIK